MREIKFRGKCVDRDLKPKEIKSRGKRVDRDLQTKEIKQNGKVIIGSLDISLVGMPRTYISGFVIGDKKQTIPIKVEVDPETVGQYTGFTDASGRQLYEGDKIKRHYAYDIDIDDRDETEYRIKYNTEEGGWEVVHDSDGYHEAWLCAELAAADYVAIGG